MASEWAPGVQITPFVKTLDSMWMDVSSRPEAVTSLELRRSRWIVEVDKFHIRNAVDQIPSSSHALKRSNVLPVPCDPAFA